MNAGRLDRRVTIERRAAGVSEYGHPADDAWEVLATVWANIKPIGGRERMRGESLESTLTHTVGIRYNAALAQPTLADAWRIKYGERLLNITAARTIDEGRHWIIFDCTEGSISGD